MYLYLYLYLHPYLYSIDHLEGCHRGHSFDNHDDHDDQDNDYDDDDVKCLQWHAGNVACRVLMMILIMIMIEHGDVEVA